MHYPARGDARERHTLCISSQAGCAVGCPFCATGELGLRAGPRDGRDRRPGPARRAAPRRGRQAADQRRVHGHGRAAAQPRPGAGVDRRPQRPAAVRAWARGTSRSRTSGVVPGIRRLTALGPQFTLAVSLHAARNALRDVLVPLNRRWPVEEVVEAAREHAAATGRRVTYEVTMIDGINDTDADADALGELLRGEHAHVNLIPMNPVAHTPWTGTPAARDRAVRGAPPDGGHHDDDPRQPRHGDRRGVRPAGRRARRPARADRRPAAPRAARGRERPGAARRAVGRAGPGRGGGGLT